MKHLIVVAHPVEASLTMTLAGAFAHELQRLGHSPHTLDLYRMRFDPVLPAGELAPAGTEHAIDAVVLKAQQHVFAADVLTVIYPLWWLSMPAILKGFVDRVFARGFAYASDHGSVRPLLAGRKAVLITLSGAPLPVLMQSGNWKSVQDLQDTHIFRAAGFDLLEHLHIDSVAAPLGEALVLKHLERVRACARQHFTAA